VILLNGNGERAPAPSAPNSCVFSCRSLPLPPPPPAVNAVVCPSYACLVADSEPWRDESRRKAKLDVISRLRQRTSRPSDPGILMVPHRSKGWTGNAERQRKRTNVSFVSFSIRGVQFVRFGSNWKKPDTRDSFTLERPPIALHFCPRLWTTARRPPRDVIEERVVLRQQCRSKLCMHYTRAARRVTVINERRAETRRARSKRDINTALSVPRSRINLSSNLLDKSECDSSIAGSPATSYARAVPFPSPPLPAPPSRPPPASSPPHKRRVFGGKQDCKILPVRSLFERADEYGKLNGMEGGRGQGAFIWEMERSPGPAGRLFANVSPPLAVSTSQTSLNRDNLQLVLNSMHKYQPRIHLVKRPDSGTAKPIVDLEKEPHKTFIFPEAIFTAVTAYQNQLVSFTLFLATVTLPPFLLRSRSLSLSLSLCPFLLLSFLVVLFFAFSRS